MPEPVATLIGVALDAKAVTTMIPAVDGAAPLASVCDITIVARVVLRGLDTRINGDEVADAMTLVRKAGSGTSSVGARRAPLASGVDSEVGMTGLVATIHDS